MTVDVLDDDNRVVHDEACRDRQRHQREVVEAVAEKVHRAERPEQRQRNRNAWNDGRAGTAQEHEHHQYDQKDGQHERALDVRTEARMVVVRSMAALRSTAAGSSARNSGSNAFTRSTVSMMLAPVWRNTCSWTAGLPFVSPVTRMSWTESRTLPRSASRMGAPLRYATINGS